MNQRAMQLFFSLLALIALGGAVLLVLDQLTRRRLRPLQQLRDGVASIAVPLAALVAVTSMVGSLYFSEVANLVPCQLCWYQRIAMYSLAVVLVVAAIRRDRGIRFYAWPLAAIGAGISTYHYLIEWWPDLESDGVCSVSVPCTFVWFRRLGFVTLPFMALCGFLAVIVLLTCRPEEER
ncbi:MAG: disulfide bond formation protein B [Acidimicrobiia bacterium]